MKIAEVLRILYLYYFYLDNFMSVIIKIWQGSIDIREFLIRL